MKFEIKHAMTLVIIGFLAIAPIMAAANSNTFVAAQDEIDLTSLIEKILDEGAEVIFASINEEGEPGVIYGQLGIPSEELGLSLEMYEDCIAMALVSTHGEFLEMILDLVGLGTPEGGTSALQFGDDGMDMNSILDMIGTEFNLLINAFLDVPEATSNTRMAAILNHMGVNFGFSFTELFKIRIDENMFPADSGIELPFDSLDIFIHQEESEFADAVDSMFSVMNEAGFLTSINENVFTNANAAAAGLIAIPDIAAVLDMVEGFMGDSGGSLAAPSPLFQIAQSSFPLENLTGSIAIAAVGYLGEQILSTTDTSISLGTLVGATTPLTPITGGQALVIGQLPSSVNITSYTPNTAGLVFYENETNMVIWNSTALGAQNDYVIYFDEGNFPPMISINRAFSPNSTIVGGSTTVTVTVTNNGEDPITDVTIDDSGIGAIYSTITVTGDTSGAFTSIAAGASEHITYTVTFTNEGGYTFPKAVLEYNFEGDSFTKDTIKQGYTVSSDPIGFLTQLILDSWPYSGAAIGLVALVGIYSIRGLVKSKDGGSSFQV